MVEHPRHNPVEIFNNRKEQTKELLKRYDNMLEGSSIDDFKPPQVKLTPEQSSENFLIGVLQEKTLNMLPDIIAKEASLKVNLAWLHSLMDPAVGIPATTSREIFLELVEKSEENPKNIPQTNNAEQDLLTIADNISMGLRAISSPEFGQVVSMIPFDKTEAFQEWRKNLSTRTFLATELKWAETVQQVPTLSDDKKDLLWEHRLVIGSRKVNPDTTG